MYVSNRKNGYKVIRRYKRSPRVKLLSKYGAVFVTELSKLESNGYRFIKSKPASFH